MSFQGDTQNTKDERLSKAETDYKMSDFDSEAGPN
jgi:hypothetical protein